jgi:hypothetical protein
LELPDSTANWDNWESVLNAMEASIAASKSAVPEPSDEHFGSPVWVMPSYLGPMPAELRSRANRILGNQQESIRTLEERKKVAGKHLAVLASVPPARPGGTAAYLDVTG